jgi:protein-tyrosine phosphatase
MTRFRILAVCTANICRSPMVEILLRRRLDPELFEVSSAGVMGWRDAPVDSMVVLELERLGVSADDFCSRPLERQMVESADLILTATRAQRSEVAGRVPNALRRNFTLLEFVALVDGVEADSPADLVHAAVQRRNDASGDVDLPDPFRQPPAVHRAVADQVAAAVHVIADRLEAAAARTGI